MMGFMAFAASYPAPIRSSAPGVRFSMMRSAFSTRRRKWGSESGDFRSRMSPFLLAFQAAYATAYPRWRGCCLSKPSPSGDSTRITLAPMEPRRLAAQGPTAGPAKIKDVDAVKKTVHDYPLLAAGSEGKSYKPWRGKTTSKWPAMKVNPSCHFP